MSHLDDTKIKELEFKNNLKQMPDIKIIQQPITRVELKKIAEERYGDLKEREILSWIRYNFIQYKDGVLSEDHLKEALILGMENIL